MEYVLNRSQQLNCDIETAWRFFSSPYNLSCITPKQMGFKVLTHLDDDAIYEGMVIDYKVSPLLHIPMYWRTIITQVHVYKSFTDFQQKGPYKYWNHYHEFVANENGVLMKDTVHYALPMGLLGKVAHAIVVRKKLEHIFNYRYEVLKKLFPLQS
ncbi:MAG: SRPBCC family protein [Chitinophagaceae bacterium]|nr:SRPBCC family protein [Chitinophagaceae bacterium]